MRGSVSPSNTWFLGPSRVLNPNSISISSAVFAGLTNATDRQTLVRVLLCYGALEIVSVIIIIIIITIIKDRQTDRETDDTVRSVNMINTKQCVERHDDGKLMQYNQFQCAAE